jgi:hypothetical protein
MRFCSDPKLGSVVTRRTELRDRGARADRSPPCSRRPGAPVHILDKEDLGLASGFKKSVMRVFGHGLSEPSPADMRRAQ